MFSSNMFQKQYYFKAKLINSEKLLTFSYVPMTNKEAISYFFKKKY